MPRSSSGSRRLAYRLMALPFAGLTAYLIVLFVGALRERTFRSDLPLYAFLAAVCAVGLWLERSWGRSLALIFAIGNAGLGGLGLLATILEGDPALAPGLLLAGSVAVAVILSRPVFDLPQERQL